MDRTCITSPKIDEITAGFESLRLAALISAAKASKHPSRVSLGPNGVHDVFGGTEEVRSREPEKPREPKSEPVKSRSGTLVTLDDLRAVGKKMELKKIEKQIAEEVRKEIRARNERMAEAGKKIEQNFIAATRAAEQRMLARMAENERALTAALEDHERAAKELEASLAAQSEESKRRQASMKERSQLLEKFRALHELFKRAIEKFMRAYTVLDKSLQVSFGTYKSSVFQKTKAFEETFVGIDMSLLTMEDLAVAQQLYQDVDSMTSQMLTKLAEMREKQEAEAQAREEAQKKAAAAALELETAEKERLAREQQERKARDAVDRAETSEMSQFVSRDAHQRYEAIMAVYRASTEEIKPLQADESMKIFKSSCQFAVNVPINAISSLSSEHLTDKHDKLVALLRGKKVKISNGEISVQSHPLGQTYAKLLLAKKFVNQADTIMSNSSAEFSIASVLVALWKQFPDVGTFFLAYLYKECPYFVPFFIPQVAGQSNEDYAKSLGYRVGKDGISETQEQYLKRMVGVARLYSAVWITTPRRGDNQPHPHGLEFGWRWLTNILNLDPLPDICATLIYETLQTAGNALLRTYGKQFFKLLQTMQRQYMEKLKQVDNGGPKARLETFLNKVLQEQRISPPEKMLPQGFW